MERVDDDHIRVGSRVVKFMAGQFEIAASGEWSLHQSSISPCGEWQNYKLYRDVAKAPKNVFFVTRRIGEQRLHRTHDVMVIEEYYPGMLEWIHSSLNGVPKTAPTFAPGNGWERKTHPPIDYSSDQAVSKGIKNLINIAWEEGTPLSPYSQTRIQGRYAPQILAREIGLKEKDVEFTIDQMLEAGEIEYVQIKDQGRRISGLALKDRKPPPPYVSSQSSRTDLSTEKILEIMGLIKAAWQAGKPLSSYSQTRRQGRYAPANIAKNLEIEESAAASAIIMLIRKGFIGYAVADKATKLKGLRILREFMDV